MVKSSISDNCALLHCGWVNYSQKWEGLAKYIYSYNIRFFATKFWTKLIKQNNKKLSGILECFLAVLERVFQQWRSTTVCWNAFPFNSLKTNHSNDATLTQQYQRVCSWYYYNLCSELQLCMKHHKNRLYLGFSAV